MIKVAIMTTLVLLMGCAEEESSFNSEPEPGYSDYIPYGGFNNRLVYECKITGTDDGRPFSVSDLVDSSQNNARFFYTGRDFEMAVVVDYETAIDTGMNLEYYEFPPTHENPSEEYTQPEDGETELTDEPTNEDVDADDDEAASEPEDMPQFPGKQLVSRIALQTLGGTLVQEILRDDDSILKVQCVPR